MPVPKFKRRSRQPDTILRVNGCEAVIWFNGQRLDGLAGVGVKFSLNTWRERNLDDLESLLPRVRAAITQWRETGEAPRSDDPKQRGF